MASTLIFLLIILSFLFNNFQTFEIHLSREFIFLVLESSQVALWYFLELIHHDPKNALDQQIQIADLEIVEVLPDVLKHIVNVVYADAA